MVPAPIKEFVLRRLLREVYRDMTVDDTERELVRRLYPWLSMDREQFQRIQSEVREHSRKQPLPGEFDLERFIHDVREHMEDKLDSRKALEGMRSLLQALELNHSEFLPETVEDMQAGYTSRIISKTMDPECKKLLLEVANKNWELELEDFRNRLIEDQVDEAVQAMAPKLQEMGIRKGVVTGAPIGFMLGLLVGPAGLMVWPIMAVITGSVALALAMGGVGFFLGFASLLFLPIISAIVAQIQAGWASVLLYGLGGTFGALFGGCVGAGLNMRRYREKLMEPDSYIRVEKREKLSGYVLTPANLLRFWELRLETFLKEKKNRIRSRIQESLIAKQDMEKLIRDIRVLKATDMEAQIQPLTNRILAIDSLIEDANVVTGLLNKLENRFSEKIVELKILVQRQAESERLYDQRRALGGRVAKALGDADSQILGWQQDKENLDLAIHGMVESFQSQLAHTRDFVEAEIQLVETH
ncbi:MAG: hypothetical protein H3C47_02055 [Candidatus Cloacimonetes bacterium]|nr:hypothetical protein [Candidatus Cloacimonadota bacterium]